MVEVQHIQMDYAPWNWSSDSGVPRILQMCMHILFCVLCVCEEKKAREEYVLHFVPTSSYATVNPPFIAFT